MIAFAKVTIALPVIFALTFLHGLVAQSKDAIEAKPSFVKKELLPLIENRMQQPGGDTSSYYIIEKIRAYCGDNYECSRDARKEVLSWLWHKGWFKTGIPVAKEEVRLADLHGTMENRIEAYDRLTVFYWWVGNSQEFYLNMEKIKTLYEEANMPHKAIETEVAILDGKAWYLNEVDGLLPELNKLLEKAIGIGNELTIIEVRSKIMHIAEGHGMYGLLEEHLTEMEKYPFSDPLTHEESSHAYYAANRRGILLKVEGKFDEAKKYFIKSLGIARDWNHPYREASTFRQLAELEWDRGNAPLAKAYLDTAFQYADSLMRHDELSSIYKLKTEIAEKEKRFEDALLFNKKMHFHQEVYDSSSIGFDAKSYYLQMEKDQLATEKKAQELALQLRSNQLKFSIAIVALVVLAAIGLFMALRNQRRRKEELAARNTLIQQQAEQLKALDAAKSRFFANISHELRTPLTLILGPVKSLLKGNHPPEQQEKLLNIALQSGQQLQQLVNEILDLRKLEMGKMELHEMPSELSSFFNRYSAQFESLAVDGGIDFSYEADIAAGTTALLDQEKYRQVLHNLLSNAFKFTPAGGSVKAKISLDGNLLTLEVADTGAGIHPDDLPHVFDRFYQTSRPDATAQGGTGIGLALCNEYVQLFGGKMDVESRFGEGSTFRATFPVTLTESSVEAEAKALENVPIFQSSAKAENAVSAKPAGGTLPTILVVEDNPELQAYIRFILTEKYNVITAGNGQEALAVLQSVSPQSTVRQSIVHSPSDEQEPGLQTDGLQTDGLKTDGLKTVDLILSDLMMPVMDGYQLLEQLKGGDATRHIPVIMLTARAEAKDKLRALRIGVDDYLTKPFDEEELLVRIENLLANHAVRIEAAAETQTEGEAPDISQPEKEWLENFEDYVQENLANDALTVTFLAHEFAMSDSTLLRQVTRLTGLSPKQYLQEVRLNQARQLLESRAFRTVARVAAAAGFSNARTFTRSFRERFGKSPSEYLNG